MIGSIIYTEGEECHPPLSVGVFYEVAVSRALHLTVLRCHAAMGEYRVAWATFVWAVDVAAAGDGEAMGNLCASLGDEQIVVVTFLIYMRSFRVSSASASPYAAAFGELLACCGVNLAESDGVVGIAHHIAFAVFEIQRGVDALLLQPYRFAPRAFRL